MWAAMAQSSKHSLENPTVSTSLEYVPEPVFLHFVQRLPIFRHSSEVEAF